MPFVEGHRRFDSRTELRNSVLFRHQLLDNSRAIRLKPKKEKLAQNFLSSSFVVFEEMREEYADWIDQQTEGLGKRTAQKVEVSFQNGIKTFILRQYKIARTDSSNPEDNIDVPGLIAGYSIDFAKVFHGIRKLGIKPEMAAKIAAQSSYHRPGVLIGLASKYKNLPQGIIYEATRYPLRDPWQYLASFTNDLSRLSKNPRYKDFGRKIIVLAIKGYSDPEGFLDNVIVAIDRMSSNPRYSDFSPAEIRDAAIGNPRSPEIYFDRLIVARKSFLEDPRFKALARSTIKKIVASNLRNPESALIAIMQGIDSVFTEQKYQGFTKSVVEVIITRHPKSYREHLNKIITSKRRLLRNSRYAALPLSIIDRAVIYHPSSPRKFLDGLIRTRDTLLQDPRYKSVGLSAITKAITLSPRNYKKILDNYIATVKRLSADPRYQGIGRGYIRSFALRHPRNTEKNFEKFAKIRTKLLTNHDYTKLGIGDIQKIVFSSANPTARMQEIYIARRSLLLDPHYKSIPPAVIIRAIVHRSNPERFLEAYMAKKRKSPEAKALTNSPGIIKEDSEFGNDATDFSEDISVIAEELIDLWEYMQNHEGMRSRVIEEGLLTHDELTELTEFFEGEGEIPTGAVLDRFSLAVAKLA